MLQRRLARGRSAWLSPIDFADAASPMPIAPPSGAQRHATSASRCSNFANITGNAADDWIGQGIAESLTADLTRIKSIAVVPREQIFELQRSLSELGRSIDDRQAIELGRRLGATVDGQRRLSAPRRPHPHHRAGHRGGHRPAADDRQGRRPARRSVRAAGSSGQRARPAGSRSKCTQQDRAAMEHGRHRIDRGVSGLLARHAEPAAGRARVDGARDRAVRTGDRARSRTTSRRWSSSPARSSSRPLFLVGPGRCSRRASRWPSARSPLRPDDADAHVQRGDTLLAMGRVDEAIAALQRGRAAAARSGRGARQPGARVLAGQGPGRRRDRGVRGDAAAQPGGRLHASAARDALHAARRLRARRSAVARRRSGCRTRRCPARPG